MARPLPAGLLLLLLHPRRPPPLWSRQFLLAFFATSPRFCPAVRGRVSAARRRGGYVGSDAALILMGLAWLQDGVRPTPQMAVAGVMGLVGCSCCSIPLPIWILSASPAPCSPPSHRPGSGRWMQRWPGGRSAGPDRLAAAAGRPDADPAGLVAGRPHAPARRRHSRAYLADPPQHGPGLLGLALGTQTPAARR